MGSTLENGHHSRTERVWISDYEAHSGDLWRLQSKRSRILMQVCNLSGTNRASSPPMIDPRDWWSATERRHNVPQLTSRHDTVLKKDVLRMPLSDRWPTRLACSVPCHEFFHLNDQPFSELLWRCSFYLDVWAAEAIPKWGDFPSKIFSSSKCVCTILGPER